MKLIMNALGMLAALTVSSIGVAQTVEKKALTLDAAKKVIAAAVAEAKSRNAPGGAIAVVDEEGNLVAVERLDNTFAAGAQISIGKARTAAIFRRPSKEFEDQVKNGRIAALSLPGATPLQGGVPLVSDGKVVGAIGVSGNTPQEDEDIALAGAKIFAGTTSAAKSDSPNVTYFPAKKVSKAFEKGMPLLEIANYKVHASHREGAGMVEVHTRDTDIIYMLEGTATLVTGGTLVDGRNIEPEEIRGKEIRGGETRRITKGDVIIVPNGVPHWFKEVQGPINYYVVKVRSVS
ncbi:MAG: heme-binding protein [Deltaproteobacteria bacterium]|nr:heme-binding protein [Deltaproteobacteria bacterium]